MLAILKWFPNYFTNIIFVSVGVIDSGSFKGAEEIVKLEERVRNDLEKYVRCATQYNIRSDFRMEMSTEAVPSIEKMCRQLAKEFPDSMVFAGKLIFRKERWYQKILHNETALSLQRRLHLDGIPTMVLPIRA